MNKSLTTIAALNTQLADLQRKKVKLEEEGQPIRFNDLTSKGMAKPTLGNTEQLVAHYDITIQHNEMTKDLEISFADKKFHRDTELNTSMSYFKALARDQDLPVSDIFDHVGIIANNNHYHPVRDWIDSAKWDGTDRLQEYYDSLIIRKGGNHAEDVMNSALKEILMRKWAMSAVAALYNDNFSCEGVLCLSGDQAIGKTSWALSLTPREYQSKWVKDAVTLDVGNKDSVLKAVSAWITELGELDATFRKSDLEALKGFITERVDVLRPPYERKANSYSRRTVMYATINSVEFLQDEENRRFWTLDVEKVIQCTFDTQQFWAEMKVLYESVEPLCRTAFDREKNQEWGWFLTPTERKQLQSVQKKFKSIDPICEIVQNNIVTAKLTNSGLWLNCTAILQACGITNPDRRATNSVSKWLRKEGYNFKQYTKQYYVNVVGQGKSSVPSLSVVKND